MNKKITIAIQGPSTLFENTTINHIEKTFNDIFPDSKKVLDISSDDYREIVYTIKKPLIENDEILKDFFIDLEILLEELKDYKPHFTQYRGELHGPK